MRAEEFSTQMNRLVETFGKSAYGTERTRIIWEEVQNLPAAWFSKQVGEWIGTLRQAPLIDTVREAISKERERGWSQERRAIPFQDRTSYSCAFCRDSGTFLCVKISEPTSGFWAFRCHCSSGLNDTRKQIPHYVQEHEKDFQFYEFANQRRGT